MKRVEVRIAMDGGLPDFTTPGYEFVVDGIALVVHRMAPHLGWGEAASVGWSITEPITGRGIGRCFSQTRGQAITAATEMVKHKGAEAFRSAIRSAAAS